MTRSLRTAVLGLSLLFTGAAVAETSPDGVFRDVDETRLGSGPRQIVPLRYRTFTADVPSLERLLAQAPVDRGGPVSKVLVMYLPLPYGGFGSFFVEESSIMEEPLARKFPEIKTYRGQGIDDPTASARMDLTPAGFHAQILSETGAVYIDPYRRGDRESYLAYDARDNRRTTSFQCGFDQENPGAGDDVAEPARTSLSRGATNVRGPLAASGATLRTYRLALAATGEYTAFFGGTVPLAMAAIVTSVNRVDGIYEKEVAVRLVLVANNNLIVYTDALTDPYTNNSGSTMLSENQTNLTNVIGTANYDVGHVFSTGGGGVATLNGPCSASTKARGVTGSSSPVGDNFDVDYVAHEMGHQFGAPHTFNGTTTNCGGGNRSASDAYEPGSGSTIMAYAGICGAEDLQPHSDPYFHVKSFDRIVTFTTTGGGNACAAQTATGNSAPTVNAGAARTIPAQTPFTLTGSATDPDTDPLTYCWEEFDLGTAAPPNTDDGSRPIFRSFNPTTSASRTFPKLSDILANTTTFGEALPTSSRTMTFRLTARDNKTGGGGVNYASTTVSTIAAAGPFLVTAPNTAITWGIGSIQPVTWNVAGTTAAPISCANVDILLSTDGGATFPTTLVAATPNDGTESVTVPNTPTTQARVKVACSSNIFFDIGNANFTIAVVANTPPTINAGSVSVQKGGPSLTGATIATVGDAETAPGSLTVVVLPGGTATGITLSSITNTGGTITANVSAACNATSGTVVLQVTDGFGAPATSNLTVTATSNPAPAQGTYSTVSLNLGAGGTATPTVAPTDNGSVSTLTATAPGFTGTLTASPATGVVTIGSAGPAGTYTVTVTATDDCGATSTRTFSLQVNGPPTITAASGVAAQKGSPGGAPVTLATVGDVETPAGTLTVAVDAGGTATGVTFSSITNTAGTVTGVVTATCTATSGTVKLRVTDGGALFTTADVAVTVSADASPVQGTYAATTVNVAAGTTVTPTSAPTDNGSIVSLTATAPGFAGTLAANSTSGVVTIGNAGPAGGYTVTLTATDNCGLTSTRTFGLVVNGPPTISGASISRQQGSVGTSSTLATVGDSETAVGALTVSQVGGSATGVTVTGLVNTAGTITGSVAASCTATSGSVLLQVTDGGGLTATSAVDVTITANAAPVVGAYPGSTNVSQNGSGSITPASAPTDNGTISTASVSIPGFTGTATVDKTTGVVSISNAAPVGTFLGTVSLVDACGATSTPVTFGLQVAAGNTQPSITAGAALSRARGAAGTSSSVATVSDLETSAGALVVTALTVPAGLTVTGISNTGGAVTATVAASCAATLGANLVTFQVFDGALTRTADLTVVVTANTVAPVVTPPATAAVTVDQTTCGGTTGATLQALQAKQPAQFAALTTLVNGGSAVDDCTAVPTRLAARLGGADIGSTTVFPLGTSTVQLRFADADGNIGTASVSVTVRKQGDANLDDVIDIFDNLLIANLLVGNLQAGVPPFSAPASLADANGDGTLDIFDILLHQSFIVGNTSCLTP